MLTREDILAADDLQRITVAVPEWGGEVGLRVLTGGEQDWFGDLVGVDPTKTVPLLRETLLAMTLCDAQGGRLFSVDEVSALANKAGGVLKRLFDLAAELNGLRGAALEDIAKNSVRLPDDASGINLPLSLGDAPSASGNR